MITNLVEMIVNYKINVKFYKYKTGLLIFRNIINYLDIDNLDVNIFHNQLHFDFNSNYNDKKRYDLVNKDKVSNV